MAANTETSVTYRDIEVMLFNTCNFNCAYCGFVTTGTVAYHADMDPFRDRAYIDAVLRFFHRYSSPVEKWNLLFSGGEPLLTPNLPYLSGELIRAGNKLRYNTNLSVPIERDEEWLAANPPHGVDVIMASLHPEGLEKYDAFMARAAALKSLGYSVVTRMVAHPKLFEWFDRVERDTADIGVSFTPIPMFSNRYPQAYTPEQRSKITAHVKGHAGMIQLNGGLDVADRMCYAGSRLFALGLGRTGKGNLYRCVSCSPNGYMGNIFSDEPIKFLSAPARCCQKKLHCTCAFHFESNAVIGAEDGDNYTKLKNGTATPVAAEFDELVRRNDLKFKFHESAPQGTEIGEKMLIYRADKVIDMLLGESPTPVFQLSTENLDVASAYKDEVVVETRNGEAAVAAVAEVGGGIRFEAAVETGRRTCIEFAGKVKRGNAVIAPYSADKAHFWHAIPKHRGHNVVTEAFSPQLDRLTVYVYADEPVEIEFSRITIYQEAAPEAGRVE